MRRELGIYVNQISADFEEFIEKASVAGFKYLATQDSIEWLSLSKAERRKKIAETKKLCEKYSLKFIAHHSNPILLPSLNVEESFCYLRNLVEEISNWEISFYVLHHRSIQGIANPWTIIENVGKEKFDRATVEVLKRICDYAARFKISLALENLPYPYAKSVDDILEVIDMVNRENLGICFDSGHSHIATDSVYEELEKAGKKLLTTHFHDNRGNNGEIVDEVNVSNYDLHLVPGLGIIDWISVNEILDKIHYTYPVVFEGIRGIENHGKLLEIVVMLWRSFENLITEAKNE